MKERNSHDLFPFETPHLPSTTVGPFLVVAALGLTSLLVPIANAADITMTSSNASGSSGFNSGTGWPGGVAPTSGNNYFTGVNTLRSPNSGSAYTFAGDSLTISSGGRLLGKTTGSQTLTVNNLILAGGLLDQANANTSTGVVLTVAGNMAVNSSSFLGALGGTTVNSTFETLDITAAISGSGALAVAGSANGGANTGVVRLSAANTYSGTISVNQPGSGFIASATNRLLQLNHLNALQNATLSLNTTAANGVSFSSAANTGTFNIGALSGTANQALADTAGMAVTLQVGGNNGTTSYSGTLSGTGGALVKAGNGTLTLSGANTYTGGTTINSGGTLALGSTGSISNSSVITVNGTLDTTAKSSFTIGSSQTLNGTGTLNIGTGKNLAVDGSAIIAPTASASGTKLSITGTTTFSTGSIFEWDLNAATTDPGAGASNSGNYGQLAGTGTIGGSGAVFKILLGSNNFTDAFWNSNKSWTNIFTGSGATNNLASVFSGGFSGTGVDPAGVVLNRGTFTFNGSSTLTWTAVPEPSSALGALLMVGGLLRRRRTADGDPRWYI